MNPTAARALPHALPRAPRSSGACGATACETDPSPAPAARPRHARLDRDHDPRARHDRDPRALPGSGPRARHDHVPRVHPGSVRASSHPEEVRPSRAGRRDHDEACPACRRRGPSHLCLGPGPSGLPCLPCPSSPPASRLRRPRLPLRQPPSSSRRPPGSSPAAPTPPRSRPPSLVLPVASISPFSQNASVFFTLDRRGGRKPRAISQPVWHAARCTMLEVRTVGAGCKARWGRGSWDRRGGF